MLLRKFLLFHLFLNLFEWLFEGCSLMWVDGGECFCLYKKKKSMTCMDTSLMDTAVWEECLARVNVSKGSESDCVYIYGTNRTVFIYKCCHLWSLPEVRKHCWMLGSWLAKAASPVVLSCPVLLRRHLQNKCRRTGLQKVLFNVTLSNRILILCLKLGKVLLEALASVELLSEHMEEWVWKRQQR